MSLQTLESRHALAAVSRRSLAVAALLACAGTAGAQTPFGENGLLTIPFENAADAAGFGISVADPSRILLSANVGDWQFGIEGDELGLLQLTREGARDPAFGNNGEVITDFEVFGALGGFVAPHDDGHLAIAGSPAAAMGVARFDAAGDKDAGFGADAKVTLDFPDDVSSFAEDALVDGSDRIVLGGRAGSAATSQAALARVLATGDPDDTFGDEGLVLVGFPTHTEWAEFNAIAEDSEGRIVAAGMAQSPDTMVVARFEENGDLDDGFDDDGLLTIDFGQLSTAEAVLTDGADRVLVGGCVEGLQGNQLIASGFTLVRLLEDGSPDPGFGTDGRVIAPIGPLQSGCIEDLTIDAQGRVMAAGWFDSAEDRTDFAAARFLDDGGLDPTFGTGGIVTVSFPDTDRGLGQAVAIDAEGRILVAGYVRMNDDSHRVAVACFREHGQLCFPARYEYAAKLICGVQPDPDDMRLARGFYATTVNIHNSADADVRLFKKLALTIPPGGQRPGDILPIAEDRLGYDEALAADCTDISKRVFQGDLPSPTIEGFVIIQSTHPLDVTAVYSTAALDRQGRVAGHSSIDVEHVGERDLGKAIDLSVEKSIAALDSNTFDEHTAAFLRYRVEVTNHGPGDATDVTVTDRLEAEIPMLGINEASFDASHNGVWSVVDANETMAELEIAIPELPASETAVLEFDASLVFDSAEPIDVTNTATVKSETADSNPGNDSAHVVTSLGQ